jgi:hypothetical protein
VTYGPKSGFCPPTLAACAGIVRLCLRLCTHATPQHKAYAAAAHSTCASRGC